MYFFLLLIFSIIVQLFFPWWAMSIPCALLAILLAKSSLKAFLVAFLTIFLTWSVMSIWIDYRNEGILSYKIAQLFNLSHKYLLIIITGSIGGLVAGLSALSGYFLKTLFITKN